MHTQRPQRILRRSNRVQRLILPDIPKLDLAVPTATDQLAESTTLHVHVGDPLLMVAPDFDHRHCRTQALVEDADGTVAITANEHISGYLVGGERGYAGPRAGRDVLQELAVNNITG